MVKLKAAMTATLILLDQTEKKSKQHIIFCFFLSKENGSRNQKIFFDFFVARAVEWKER